MAKAKKKIEEASDKSGQHTRRFASRPGYAERIKKEKISDAVNDTTKNSTAHSGV
jgi:hypothetical protein